MGLFMPRRNAAVRSRISSKHFADCRPDTIEGRWSDLTQQPVGVFLGVVCEVPQHLLLDAPCGSLLLYLCRVGVGVLGLCRDMNRPRSTRSRCWPSTAAIGGRGRLEIKVVLPP